MKEKKLNGFTLIELLAVIVILAIIALIATPIILNVIEESRENANKDSVYSMVKAADIYYAQHVFDGSISFDENGIADIKDKIKLSGGIPNEFEVKVNRDGKIFVEALFDDMCFTKDYTSSEVVKGEDGNCGASSGGVTGEIIKDKLVADNTDDTLVAVGDDLRFRGANVNNYVTFNDESWRIIGFINDKIKLIKATPLPSDMPWASSYNNWTTSSLQEYLNGEYYDDLTPVAQNMIETVIYKLGGINSTDKSVDEIYAMENGTAVYMGRPLEITNSKIAIMYPSDYGYSMASTCTKTPYNYKLDDACKAEGTWLYNGGINEWLLAPSSGHDDNASYISSIGYLNCVFSNVYYSRSVRPSLYLKSSVKIFGGEGTEGNPYTLS